MQPRNTSTRALTLDGRPDLQNALEAMPVPVMVLDTNHDVVFVNVAAARTFGVDAESAEGRPATDFFVIAAGSPAGQGIRANGERFAVAVVQTPLGTGAGAFVLAVVTDMDDDQRNEGRLRTFVLAAATAMLLVRPDGTISLSNPSADLLFDYSAGQLMGMSVEQLVPAALRRHHRDLRADFDENPDRHDMSMRSGLHARARDGTDVLVAISLSPVQLAGEDHVLVSIADLRAQQRERDLESAVEAHRLHAEMLANLSFSVIAVDVDGLVVSANPAALALLGVQSADLLRAPFISIIDPDELQRLAVDAGQFTGQHEAGGFDLLRQLARGSTGDDREITYVCRNGATIVVNQVFTAMRDSTGRLHGYLAVAHDVSRRRVAEERLAHMASHDELTGLPNRATFVEHLDSLIASASLESFTVVMFDIDHLGRVNEALGHRIGDELLAAIARRLRRLTPGDHLIARVGGDKFGFIVAGAPGRDGEGIATTVEDLLEPFAASSHDVRLGATIGAARYPQDAVDATSLVKSADAAITGAKSDSRGSMRWFDAARHHEVGRSLELQAALPLAIENGEIAMYYQPVMSLTTGLMIGVEALARWTSPVFGSVPPSDFIPIAEEDGTILRLGEWSLRRSCADIAALRRRVGRDLTLAVNVSPYQFRGQAWADIVADALAASGLEPDQLELEITENIFISHPHAAIEAIAAVRSQGINVVLDDFGTGYSSFSYLTRFPLDKIKIDRSFVGRLVAGGADAAVVEAIIAMAHTLGMRVVAEGVELASQAQFLSRHGCDEAQGYLYSPAVPFDELVLLAEAAGRGDGSGEPARG